MHHSILRTLICTSILLGATTVHANDQQAIDIIKSVKIAGISLNDTEAEVDSVIDSKSSKWISCKKNGKDRRELPGRTMARLQIWNCEPSDATFTDPSKQEIVNITLNGTQITGVHYVSSSMNNAFSNPDAKTYLKSIIEQLKAVASDKSQINFNEHSGPHPRSDGMLYNAHFSANIKGLCKGKAPITYTLFGEMHEDTTPGAEVSRITAQLGIIDPQNCYSITQKNTSHTPGLLPRYGGRGRH